MPRDARQMKAVTMRVVHYDGLRRGLVCLGILLGLATAACAPAPVVQPVPLPLAQQPRATSSVDSAVSLAPRPLPLTVGGWNVGLDDAAPARIEAQLAAFDGVDLWGLAEVTQKRLTPALEAAAEVGENADYSSVLSLSGRGAHLLALYNTNRFELLESYEVDAINTTGNARAPLVLHLRDRRNGAEFLFMVNHLYRSRDAERHRQAELLNAWVRSQTLPVIAVGDYNFDWDAEDGVTNHDAGYDLMTAGNAWQWVEPDVLAPTQCGEAYPCSYDDVLDFVFTANGAKTWPATSLIVVTPGDFPDDAVKSDHRPVLATFGEVE